MPKSFRYAAQNKGIIKTFRTNREAGAFAEDQRSIALYSTTDGVNFTFVKAIDLKTAAKPLAAKETVAKAA